MLAEVRVFLQRETGEPLGGKHRMEQHLQSVRQNSHQGVAYLRLADKYLGPLASHLSGVSQPVISTRSVFSTLLPSLLADI